MKGYGDEIESDIDHEIRRIMDECYSRAEKLISENMDVLHRVAALLIEKEKIDREEFESCFEESK